jgi:type IV pilus assembly protein PilE
MRFGSPTQRRPLGFTLIEVMVTVAIVAILAGIAYPSYIDYIQRSRVIDATTRLSNFRVRMEQQFMDTRAYPDAATCAALILALDPNGPSKPFTLSCFANTPTTYVIRAQLGTADYRIDELNQHLTVGVFPGWSGAGSACWVVKKDGSC